MRPAVFWLLALVVVAAADTDEEPWVEEEDVEEPYNEEFEDTHDRRRREVYVESPYEEHIRVKRKGDEEHEHRPKRSSEYQRIPRQVHQYEVYESTDEGTFPAPPFEELLAASAEHYHRAYAAPGAPAPARYLNPQVSAGVPLPVGVRPVPVYSTSVPVNAVSNPQPAKVVAQGPVQFIAPASFAVPIAAAETAPIAVAPSPVKAAPEAQVQQLASGDLYGSAAGHKPKKHSRGHAAGGGQRTFGDRHVQHGGKTSRGSKFQHHLDKGGKGFKIDEKHRKEYEQAVGQKKKNHDRAEHKGDHEEQAHGHRGALFKEKKGHKKGHKTKGYHNKYHKDEFHKEHKFYDDYHKSGEHHRYGKFNAKHASNESGKKKAHHINAGHDVVERGKKGYSNKGHLDADNKGYKGQSGHDEHHHEQSQHGRKANSQGGKKWAYAKKN